MPWVEFLFFKLHFDANKMGKDGQTQQITQIKQQSTRQEKIFAIYTNEKGLCSEYIKNYYKPIRKGQTTFTIKGKIKIDKMPEEKHTGEKTHMTIKREAAKPQVSGKCKLTS